MTYEQIISWWQEQKRDSAEDLAVLPDNFRIVFAYNSGRIENEAVTFNDTREIFENGRVAAYTGDGIGTPPEDVRDEFRTGKDVLPGRIRLDEPQGHHIGLVDICHDHRVTYTVRERITVRPARHIP